MHKLLCVLVLLNFAVPIRADTNFSRVTFDCLYDRVADKTSTAPVHPKPLHVVFTFEFKSGSFGTGIAHQEDLDVSLEWVVRVSDRDNRMNCHALESPGAYQMGTTSIVQKYGPTETYESVRSKHSITAPGNLVAYQYYGQCQRT
jgi:hypothetical protein